jgi:hypothetical protein
MKVKNMITHSNYTELLVAICQKANPFPPRPSVADYLEHYEFELDLMGRLLRFLGLAEDSDEDLGWAPTRRLMSIIAEEWAHPSKEGRKIMVSKDDRDFVASIYHLATGVVMNEDGMFVMDFCCNVLAILGLLKRGENGGFKPTRRMQYLVLQRCLNVAAKEEKE